VGQPLDDPVTVGRGVVLGDDQPEAARIFKQPPQSDQIARVTAVQGGEITGWGLVGDRCH